MSTSCFILEDQAPARRMLEHYLDRLPTCTLLGSAADPTAARAALQNLQIDLLFLDLGLPVEDGFRFLTQLAEPPVVIVTTAFGERALEGFTHGVADYLVKPFSFDRFRTAVQRAESALRARADNTLLEIPLDRGRREYVASLDILSLSADGDYVSIRLTDRRLYTLGPLSRWLERLPTPPFLQIHRSHLINGERIDASEPRSIEIAGQKLPVSASHADAVKRWLDRLS